MVAIRFDASALQTQENKSIIIEETSKTQDRYLLENHLIQWLSMSYILFYILSEFQEFRRKKRGDQDLKEDLYKTSRE
jgi:hypothetical protein